MLSVGIAAVAVSGAFVSAFIVAAPGHVSLAANASRGHHAHHSSGASRMVFSTLDNANDPTFNQLLGINNHGLIAGYFGSGAQGHANKGYVLRISRHWSSYRNENFPHSVQTQVTGLNDRGVTVGFWSSMNTASMMNNNFGFYAVGGHFHTVKMPMAATANPPVSQLLGVNNRNVAVGFYADAKGNSHGFTYSITRHRFHAVKLKGATSLTAAAINNRGDVAGFFTVAGGVTDAFLMRSGGRPVKLAYPGATMTQALGVNDRREVVGVYQTGDGDAARMHGFTWTRRQGFATVDDPHGRGATTINGVNNAGDLVGFFTDAAGNTHGMLLARGHHMAPMHSAMPTHFAMPPQSATPMPPATVAATPSATATQSPTPTRSGAPPPPIPTSTSTAPPLLGNLAQVGR